MLPRGGIEPGLLDYKPHTITTWPHNLFLSHVQIINHHILHTVYVLTQYNKVLPLVLVMSVHMHTLYS